MPPPCRRARLARRLRRSSRWLKLGGVNSARERDGTLKVKLRLLFRGTITPIFKRMFESPDDVLSLTSPQSPNVCYAWLPQPQKRVETEERDLIFFESASRLSLRAAKLAKAVLQTWDSSITDEQLLLRMRSCLWSFVKTIMQTQVAISFGCLQLRCDLAALKVSPAMLFSSYVMRWPSTLPPYFLVIF